MECFLMMAVRRIAFRNVVAITVPLVMMMASAHAMIPSAFQHYERAIQLEALKDYRGAEQEYRLALAMDPYDSMTYLKLAYILERDDKLNEAAQLYQKALEINPKDVMIRLSIAQIWERKAQPAKALAEYQEILKGNPEYRYVFLSMARTEKALGHHDEAVANYQQFTQAYPKHFDAQRELAALLFSDKKYDKAAEAYQSLKSMNEGKFKDDLAYGISLNNADKSAEALAVFQKIQTPSAVLFEQMGTSLEKLNRLTEASNAYLKAIGISPQEKNELYLKVADIAMSQNRSTDAVEALKTYLKLHPENAKVQKSLADLYLQQKDFASAAPLYQNALTRLPESEKTFRSDAYRNLGYAYQMQDNLSKAAETYEQALTLEDDHQTRLNLALAYHKQGQYTKAAELYRKILVNDPASLTVKKDLGQVLLALGDESFKKQDYKTAMDRYQDAFLLGSAEEVPALLGMANAQYALKNYTVAYTTYQRILEKDPENMIARMNKAQLDIDQKNYMPALENLRWIVERKPDNLDAFTLLAKTHEGLGDYGQALVYYKKALELQPKEASLLIGYGNAWRQVGDLDRAQQAYEMARVETPGDPMVRYNLGSIYNMRDKLDASLQEYKTAIQLNPQFIEPYYGMGTTFEKQKKLNEAIEVYQQFVEKAPPTSSYLPLAKERIEFLKKSVKTTAQVAPVTKPTPSP
jgi:tetratricopeptide (TPR) repeat protein